MALPASTQRLFRVTLSGFGIDIPGAFATFSGGNPSADVTRFREGGSPVEEVVGGPPTRDDVTIGRPYRRDRDEPVMRWADRSVGKARGSVAIQPVDEDYNPYGRPRVYSDCLLIGASWPDVDSNSGDTANVELSFAVSGEIA